MVSVEIPVANVSNFVLKKIFKNNERIKSRGNRPTVTTPGISVIQEKSTAPNFSSPQNSESDYPNSMKF